MTVGPSVNFSCVHRIFRQLPSNFCVRATVCQFSVLQRDLPPTSVNFLCARGTFRKLLLTFYTSVGTYQIFMRQQDFHQHLSTLCPSARHSVNFLFVHVTFHQLSSTFCLSVENILCGSWTFRLTSDNFLCGCVTFHQLSVHLRYHPSSFSASTEYSVNFSCVCGTFCKLPSTFVQFWELPYTFPAIVGPSVTFSQLSEWLRVFLPTFVNFA